MRIASSLLLAVGLAACAPSATDISSSTSGRALARTLGTQGRGYPLDGRDRTAPTRGKAQCSTDELVTYRGTEVRYAAPVVVHPSFAERLARFERIAREVGLEVYGRAPKMLHHGGGYSCRTMPSGRYSEHAFGNALDLEGFSFPAAAGTKQRAVRIRVVDAWRDGGSPEAKRFFGRLLERLEDRDDVFRAVIGPPDPSHRDHLHFDTGPWSYTRYAKPRGAS